MEQTDTDVPIAYESYGTGPKGSRFLLYPILNVHSNVEVSIASRWLHANEHVVSIQVRWVSDVDTEPQPDKIPDHALIKNLQVEVGKLESYITELEETHKKVVKEYAKEILSRETLEKKKWRREILKEELHGELQKKLTQAQQVISSLRKNISELVVTMNKK